jgi:predicted dehydrogenase
MMNPANPTRRTFLQSSAVAAAALGAPALLVGADVPKPNAPKPDVPPPATPQPTPPPATTEPTRLRIAVVGCGGQGRHDMRNLIAIKERIVALCDADENQIVQARKEGGKATADAKACTDYRRLLDDAKEYDAVLIATPDHWHAPLATAFIKAGKHVYCEKPLTHSIAEARALRELARANPKVVTQMGNQGSAEPSMRRSVELIRAGVLGQVRDVYTYMDMGYGGKPRPTGAQPIPAGFNWDMWCGPAPYRPFVAGVYHPGVWRQWYDFGNGKLADFACHIFNTAHRALELTYPTKIEVPVGYPEAEASARTNQVRMHFPARRGKNPVRSLDAVTVHYSDGEIRPSDEILKDVIAVYKQAPKQGGCLIVGERGSIWSNPWNAAALIKLDGEDRLRDILKHDATKSVPETLPRKVNHYQEWANACRGEGKTWSDFDTGGHLTEIGLAAVMALRVGRDVDWDGERMIAKNAPEAGRIIHAHYRKAWI